MGLLEVLRRAEDGTNGAMYECRDCGTTVSPEMEECPVCDSTEIACYKI